MTDPYVQAHSTAISVRDLVVNYGERNILNGINLEIPAGQIMVIMGGSGVGKSTLLRLVAGLLEPPSCPCVNTLNWTKKPFKS